MIQKVFILLLVSLSPSTLFGQVNNYTKYPYQNIDINCILKKTGIYIVTNTEELKSICPTTPSIRINFNQETLIGMVETTSGCQDPIVTIEIFQKVDIKELSCIMTIQSFGNCRRLFPVIRWIVINKPPHGYSINMKINKSCSN